jgi:predicted PurR-regulated permease PerM
MSEALRAVQPWLRFVGCVLVTTILYWAQAVIVPVALALLMTFLLTPVVSPLQRRIGRVPAVLAVVLVAFAALGATGWAVTQQLASVVEELPAYRENIRRKIRDVRGAGGSVETLQKTIEDIKAEIETREPPGTVTRPLVVRPEQVSGLWGVPAVIGPLLGRLAPAGLVVALVVFMLLEREDLRNRLIRLFGHGRLVVTTRAFDEAGRRVSRYLLVQSLVNLVFGAGVGVGLFLIGVPYPLLWGALAGALRFIPYVGPTVAALVPLAVALAALEGWTRPLLVLGLFVVLELLTNLVLETVVYAGAAGVSQVGLLVAVAFWSWLWGPLGLLMATPLTVCLAVMGKYVPGLEFVTTLLSDEPVLAADVSYYQRLLAGDEAEAIELVERHATAESAETVYDALMLPALNYAERDRIEERLSPEEEHAVAEATRELLDEVPGGADGANAADDSGTDRIPVLGVAAHGERDVLALTMLARLLDGTPVALEVPPSALLSSEIVGAVQKGHYRAVCIADLPPSSPSKSRYVVKRLRTSMPDLPIVVGRWAPPELADETADALLSAGATHVDARLLDSREQLVRLVQIQPRERPTTDAA